ncbi:unnamed protein product, partial [Durusdinium trenchii]
FSDYARKRAALKKAREAAQSRSSRRLARTFEYDEFDEEEAEEEVVTDDEELVDVDSEEEDRPMFGDLEMRPDAGRSMPLT